MKKLFACAAALSIMLVACSGESGTNASSQEPAPASQNTGNRLRHPRILLLPMVELSIAPLPMTMLQTAMLS